MKTVKISLNSIAKSIMGIFSLDLSKSIDLNIHATDGALDDILTVLKPYLVD